MEFEKLQRIIAEVMNVDEDEIASCFYSLADAEDDIEDNYQLAKELLNYIELEKEENPSRHQTVYTAKIRLPKIDYKF